MEADALKQDRTDVDELLQKHPCLQAKAHTKYRCIHLPVSPSCNIQCRFCKSGLTKQVKRKLNSEAFLTPQQAFGKVTQELAVSTDLTVVAIAGPGDTLASSHAYDTFSLVHKKFPSLIKCLSTNGLLLRNKAKDLLKVGVKSISVSMNASRVKTLAKICSYVLYDKQYMTGELAANWLLLSQISGIETASRLGIYVKVNTVLIPGVNDKEIVELAKVTAQAGAKVMNVVPLIPQCQFMEYRSPTHKELNKARLAVQKYLPVLDCFQCKIAACGMPGSGCECSS